MNDPESDVLSLKRIYEAERRADQMVRNAEAEARAHREATGAWVEGFLKAKAQERSEQHLRRLEEEIQAIETECRERIRRAEEEAARWIERQRPGLDAIVDRLLQKVIPS